MKAIFSIMPQKDWRTVVGQVLITTLGVLLALWASEWSERHNRREFELAALTDMHAALVDDHQKLEGFVRELRIRETRLTQLITVLDEKPVYDSAMDVLFGAAYDYRIMQMNAGAYASLKSLGIDHITNPVLRSRITRMYEVDSFAIATVTHIEENVLWEVVRPYYLRNFRDLAFGRNATPLDYSRMVADPELRNIIQYKLAGIRTNWLPTYERVALGMVELIRMLEAELTAAGTPVPAMTL